MIVNVYALLCVFCVSSFGCSFQIPLGKSCPNVQGEEETRPLRSRVPLDVNDLVQQNI